jgi:hypothetical protein
MTLVFSPLNSAFAKVLIMKFFQTFFLASLSRTVLLWGCTLGSLTTVDAQIPAFSITSEMPEFGAVQDGRRNIILRERRFSLVRYDTLPQRGRIVIRGTLGPTNATITLRMGVSYQSGTRLLSESTTATALLPSVYTDASGRTQRFCELESDSGKWEARYLQKLSISTYIVVMSIGRLQK